MSLMGIVGTLAITAMITVMITENLAHDPYPLSKKTKKPCSFKKEGYFGFMTRLYITLVYSSSL